MLPIEERKEEELHVGRADFVPPDAKDVNHVAYAEALELLGGEAKDDRFLWLHIGDDAVVACSDGDPTVVAVDLFRLLEDLYDMLEARRFLSLAHLEPNWDLEARGVEEEDNGSSSAAGDGVGGGSVLEVPFVHGVDWRREEVVDLELEEVL